MPHCHMPALARCRSVEQSLGPTKSPPDAPCLFPAYGTMQEKRRDTSGPARSPRPVLAVSPAPLLALQLPVDRHDAPALAVYGRAVHAAGAGRACALYLAVENDDAAVAIKF